MEDIVIVFVRVKDGHCRKTMFNSKRHSLIWCNGESAIIHMVRMFYEMERSWLIEHPFLSCLTEIQLIKLKL